MNVQRVLQLDPNRWIRIGPSSFWPAVRTATVASLLWSLNRFGGTLIDAPRSFVRVGLIGVYGWLGLAVSMWLLGSFLSKSAGVQPRAQTPSLLDTVAAIGVAHMPLVAFGVVVFFAANLIQVLGPGLVAAVVVIGVWFPGVLVTAARYTFRLDIGRAAVAAMIPYILWLVLVGRDLLGRIQHLL